MTFKEVLLSIPESDFLEFLSASCAYVDKSGKVVGVMYRTRTGGFNERAFIASVEMINEMRSDSVVHSHVSIVADTKADVDIDTQGNMYVFDMKNCIERRESDYDYEPFEVDKSVFAIVNGGKYLLSNRILVNSLDSIIETVNYLQEFKK